MPSTRSAKKILPGGAGQRSESVELFALGSIGVLHKGEDITESLGARRLGLLVYLFHEQRPLSPAEIIELLGRGGGEEKELEGLERAVSWLKENLPDVYIKMTNDTVEGVRGVWLDTRQVEDSIDGRDAAQVSALYRGDFLEGFSSGSAEFDEWANKERARIRRAWTNRIRSEAKTAEGAGQWESARDWWRILVARAPTRAEGVAGLLRALAMAQKEKEASQVYGEYLLRLQNNGNGEVAQAVQQIVLEFSILEPVLEEITLAPETPAPEPALLEEPSPLDLEPPAEASPLPQPPTQPEEAAQLAESVPVEPAASTGYTIPELEGNALAEGVEPAELAEAPPQLETVPGLERSVVGEDSIDEPAAPPEAEIESVPGLESSADTFTEATQEEPSELQSAAPPKKPAASVPAFFEPRSEQDVEWDELVANTSHDDAIVFDENFFPGTGDNGEAGASTAEAQRDEEFIDPAGLGSVDEAAGSSRLQRGAEMQTSGYVPSSKAKRSGPRDPSPLLLAVKRLGVTLAGVGGSLVAVLGVAAAIGRLPGRILKSRPKRSSRSVRAPSGLTNAARALRRFWYIPAVAIVLSALVVAGPKLASTFESIRTRSSESGTSALPSVSLPKVTVPKVTVRTPAFVTTSVTKLGEMFSGPLLEDAGARVVVADVVGRDGQINRALSVAFRATLSQARYFTTPPREQALLTLVRPAAWELPLPDALRLAQAQEYDLVLAGQVLTTEAGDRVTVRALSTSGDELYSAKAVVTGEDKLLGALEAVTNSLLRRIGEPSADIKASVPMTKFLSPSLDALEAYDRAAENMFAARYGSAASEAGRAVQLDPQFAMAHRLLAEAFALQGQRARARTALKTAWEFRTRLSERERLRLVADRMAFDDRLSDAVLAYDKVFSEYRDDVGSLKSQALLQRMIGVRGGGDGNLRVAFTITPVDWPELSRVARFINYRGSVLPNVDSIVASLQETH